MSYTKPVRALYGVSRCFRSTDTVTNSCGAGGGGSGRALAAKIRQYRHEQIRAETAEEEAAGVWLRFAIANAELRAADVRQAAAAAQLAEQQAVMAGVEISLAVVEDTLAICQMDLAAAEERETGLAGDLIAEQEKASELTASVATLETTLETKRVELTTAAATIAETVTQLSEAKSEVAQLEVQMEEEEKKLDALVQEKQSLETTLETHTGDGKQREVLLQKKLDILGTQHKRLLACWSTDAQSGPAPTDLTTEAVGGEFVAPAAPAAVVVASVDLDTAAGGVKNSEESVALAAPTVEVSSVEPSRAELMRQKMRSVAVAMEGTESN
jgi:hypothetical protein